MMEMNFNRQILVIFLMFCLSFPFFRCFFSGMIRYQLNKSAYRKRKKGTTFRQWLLYSRYKQEIPKLFRTIYYVTLLLHPIAALVCLLLYITGLEFSFGPLAAISVFWIDWLLLTVISLLFWQKKPGFAYQRWIVKKRGQVKK